MDRDMYQFLLFILICFSFGSLMVIAWQALWVLSGIKQKKIPFKERRKKCKRRLVNPVKFALISIVVLAVTDAAYKFHYDSWRGFKVQTTSQDGYYEELEEIADALNEIKYELEAYHRD